MILDVKVLNEELDVFEMESQLIKQVNYCSTKTLPVMIPKSGVCSKCFRNVYKDSARFEENRFRVLTKGLTDYECEMQWITSCPHCKTTFKEDEGYGRELFEE